MPSVNCVAAGASSASLALSDARLTDIYCSALVEPATQCGFVPLAKTSQCSIQSAHFSTCPSGPHGMTGTEEVEFFGEPSISLSEYTM